MPRPFGCVFLFGVIAYQILSCLACNAGLGRTIVDSDLIDRLYARCIR